MATQLKLVSDPARNGSLSERIGPFLGEIAKRTVETEKSRMVPSENIELIREAGFVRALLPAALGGDERDLKDYCDGIRTLTKACPATGWVTGVLNVHPAAIGHFHPETQKEMLATGVDTIVSSSGTPSMKAKLADGGILVNGTGRWSSGCDHAEWAIVGVKVPDPSDARYPERNYRDYQFVAHRSQFTIDDTWYSTGQRGSGSKDLVFDNVFVPYRRMEQLGALNFGYTKGHGSVDSWITHLPYALLFGVFLPAVALGCADGMLEQFTKRQKSRKNAYTGAAGILNPAGYMRLAESAHELQSLTAYYDQILDEMQGYGERRERLSEAKFFDMQARLPFITTRAVEVIERLFIGAGSSAVADFNMMQRYWRDGHTVRLHTGMDYDTAMQNHGRSMSGLPPTADL